MKRSQERGFMWKLQNNLNVLKVFVLKSNSFNKYAVYGTGFY